MTAPTQVNIGDNNTNNIKESTSAHTQVTVGATHTHNSMDTYT